MISAERARAQAVEFDHSFERECGYLVVHSILHLLGYDHVDEGPRKTLMRGFEEDIMRAALGRPKKKRNLQKCSGVVGEKNRVCIRISLRRAWAVFRGI